MIKKYLFGLGISLLGLIGFSVNAAGNTFPIGLESFPSAIDSNYSNTFLKGGAFLTNYLGQGRPIFALRNNVLVWWAKNGFPYFYLQSNQPIGRLIQGFPDRFYSCDELTGTYYSMPGNCTLGETWDYSGNNFVITNLLSGFFKTLVFDDYVYYDYVDNANLENYFDICWSSHSIGKSICFKVGSDYHNTRTIVNSQDLSNVTFARVPDSWIGYAPGQVGYGGGGNIEGGSNISDQVVMSGDLLYQKCTNSYVISQIDKEYGHDSFRNWCHAGTFDTGSIIGEYTGIVTYTPGIGVDFKYVYNNTSDGLSRNHWLESNLDTMARYKEGKFGPTNPFMGKPLYLYTYIENLYNNGLPFPGFISNYDVLNYCQLMLYSDLDAEYKGSYFKSYCDDLKFKNDFGSVNTGEIGDIDDDEILPPGFDSGGGSTSDSGVIVSSDWSGVLSGDTNKNYDGKNFINDLFQKLKTVYQKPVNGLVGIVPSYIIVFLLALILFRFLAH